LTETVNALFTVNVLRHSTRRRTLIQTRLLAVSCALPTHAQTKLVTANIDINLPILIAPVLKGLISFYPTHPKSEINYTMHPYDYSYAVHLLQSSLQPRQQYRGDRRQNQDGDHHRAPQRFRPALYYPNDYNRYSQTVPVLVPAPRVIPNDPTTVKSQGSL
jgi:hypothetical protein